MPDTSLLRSGGSVTYITTIFVTLLTLAVVVIIALVLYYRRRMKHETGASAIHAIRGVATGDTGPPKSAQVNFYGVKWRQNGYSTVLSTPKNFYTPPTNFCLRPCTLYLSLRNSCFSHPSSLLVISLHVRVIHYQQHQWLIVVFIVIVTVIHSSRLLLWFFAYFCTLFIYSALLPVCFNKFSVHSVFSEKRLLTSDVNKTFFQDQDRRSQDQEQNQDCMYICHIIIC